MKGYTLDELKGMAYDYANEDRATYVAGNTPQYDQDDIQKES